MAPSFKMPKQINKLLNNEMLVLGAGLVLVFLLVKYSQSKSTAVMPAPPQRRPKQVANVGNVPETMPNAVLSAGPSRGDNKPADLLPHDGNSEWAEFAPQGQGDLQGSGSLLQPQLSQRPFNSVQGTNALRGDPQISIGEVPSIAAPSNPIHGNSSGLN